MTTRADREAYETAIARFDSKDHTLAETMAMAFAAHRERATAAAAKVCVDLRKELRSGDNDAMDLGDECDMCAVAIRALGDGK